MVKARILVVDDEEVARLSLLRILQLEGYEVTAVGDGETALRELSRSAFDLMILDLKMHGLSGIEVVTQTSEAFPNLKVVILTAFGSMDTAIQALRYRVNDYLIKPASPKDILKSLEKALSGESLPGSEHEVSDVRAANRSAAAISKPYEQTVFHASNGVVIDCMRRRITWQDVVIHLTPTEAKIFGVLLENNALVVRHQELVQKAYGYRIGAGEAAKILRPILSRLNSKLEKIPVQGGWIRSIRGSGYLLETERAEPSGEPPAVKF
jgi:DNA-binding response OmpR family regulator